MAYVRMRPKVAHSRQLILRTNWSRSMSTLERIASCGAIVGFLFITSGCAVEPDHQYGGDRDRNTRYQDPRYQDRYQDPRYQDPRYQDPRYQDRRERDERDRHGRDHSEHHCDDHEHGDDCRD